MSFYFPNVDPVYLYKRDGTDSNPFIPLQQTLVVKYAKVTLKEIPDFEQKVTVRKANNDLLTEVTVSTLTENQYRVDYSTGMVFFHTSKENEELTFSYLGTGYVNIGANRLIVDTSENNNDLVTVQDILDEQGRLHDRVVETVTLVENNQAAKKIDVGSLSNLQTNNKTSIVNAVNEVIELTNLELDNISSDLTTKADKNELSSLTSQLADVAINVKSFGVKGDGITDDTNSIQSVLDIAKAANYLKVIIPAGVYLLSDTLRIYRNTHLLMDKGTVLLRGSESFSHMMVNGDHLVSYGEYSGHGNITIEGGILDGNYNNFKSGWNAVGFGRGENIKIIGVEFRDVVNNHALDLNAMKNVVVEKCRFLGYKAADTSRNYCEAIQISEHISGAFDEMLPYDGTPCENVTIRDCYFGNSNTAGMQSWPVGVGNHFSVHNKFNSGVIIAGNIFEGMTFAGVRAYKWKGCQITNNTFRKCIKDIMLTSVSVDGNHDSDWKLVGVAQAGGNYIISNNQSYENIIAFVEATGQPTTEIKDIVISDNIIDGNSTTNTSTFAVISMCSNVTISSNNIKNIGRAVASKFNIDLLVVGNASSNLLYEFYWDWNDTSIEIQNRLVRNLILNNNRINKCGRSAFNINTANYGEISSNIINSPAIDINGTRNGISINFPASNLSISNNIVKKAPSGNQNGYGLGIIGAVVNVPLMKNHFEGLHGDMSISPTSSNVYQELYRSNWQNVTFKNGALPYSELPCRYRKVAINGIEEVEFNLSIQNISHSTVFFTLPIGFRPLYWSSFIVRTNSGNWATLEINPDGNMQMVNQNGWDTNKYAIGYFRIPLD